MVAPMLKSVVLKDKEERISEWALRACRGPFSASSGPPDSQTSCAGRRHTAWITPGAAMALAEWRAERGRRAV